VFQRVGSFSEYFCRPEMGTVAPFEHRRISGLTPREVEVLAWIAQGKTHREIAVILGISKRTVSEHAATAIRKLTAANAAHAVAIGIQNGLI
jgi:DNA-binding CsgD family transcriptional regulator